MAVSLASITQSNVDRNALAAAMISALSGMAADLFTKKDAILAYYKANCITLGMDISLLRGDEIRHGKALDVDDSGALLVQFPDGSLQYINSGEVSIRGMYGYV